MSRATMTNRERLLRCLRREPTDRCPVRLWGVNPFDLPRRESYKFLSELVNRYDLDIFHDCGDLSTVPNWLGPGGPQAPIHSEDRESAHEGFRALHSTMRTPAGELTSIYLYSPAGFPGYVAKHYLESVEDCEKYLSIPDLDFETNADRYWAAEATVGDRGLTMIGFAEPMYFMNAQMGSEFFAIASIEHRDLIHELIATTYRRVERYVKQVLAAGISGLWGYVGPELCIPPLQSPRDFDEFVTAYDRRLIDLVHEAGGLVWCHCHGDMGPVLERFADDVGVDCLNPIEPPPIGIPLAEAKARVGERLTLEGNIESGWFDLYDIPRMREVTIQALEEGMPGGGFILCPTSDHSHWPELSEAVKARYAAFVETAMEHCWY